VPVKKVEWITQVLIPANNVIHPARYYGIFKDYNENLPFKKSEMPLLYEDMDQFSADCIEELDNELLKVSNKIKELFPEKKLDSLKSL